MSLIKASQDPAILTFGTTPRAAPEPVPSREDELEAALAAAQAALAALKADLPDQLAAARAAGIEEGIGQSQRDEQARLEALQEAVSAALDDWRARLATIDGLAVDLARDILERVFGSDGLEPDAVAAAIRTRIAALDAQNIVRLRVGSADVEQALAGSNDHGAGTRRELIVDPALAAGEAVIDLTLGAIEVGPAQQWPRIHRWLARLEANSQ